MIKDIFSYNIDIKKNAYVNWRTNRYSPIANMITIADGFMESAILLAEQCLHDNKDRKADIVIFPILFNANHAIELYLKAIIWILNTKLDTGYRIEGKHNIEQIFSTMDSKIIKFENDKSKIGKYKELINSLDVYIKELFKRIQDESSTNKKDNMDFSRYPLDEQYVNHFYIDEFDNVVVDLENFIYRFKEISKNLNMLAEHYLYDVLENDDN